MTGSKSKAGRLVERFPVTDLAIAVTFKGQRRENFLKRFVDEFTPRSFRALRDHAHLVYNAQPPLIELPPPAWEMIEHQIQRTAGQFNAPANVEVARLLRDLIRPRKFRAVLTPEQTIHLAPGKVVKVGLNFYLIEDNRIIFQFVQPRADARLNSDVARTLMSLVHYAYVVGDFEHAKIEMADFSAPFPGADRHPRFHSLQAGDLMTRDELNSEIDSVHGILARLSRE